MYKKLLIPLLLLVFPAIALAQENPNEKNEVPLYVPSASGAPKFPGGVEAMNKYISDNVKYPKKARRKNIQGTIYIDFVISATGKVSDVQVVKSIKNGELLEQEAIRVISAMPDWIPDPKDPRPSRMTIPVKFVLK